MTGGTAQPSISTQPPPLPVRPSTQLNSSMMNRYGYSGMGNVYGGMGYGPGYGLYNNGYSSYGSYGMNRYGSGAEPMGTFARQAEENSRPAFESIQSIVGAFTSVSMMLDSTFQAVYSSFNAVIGVADNFSRLKIQLMQFVSALAFIRTLKYMYRRLLELLGLRAPGTASEEWNKAFTAAAQSASNDPNGKKSSWPILMFFGIILGGPWLIWKLISSFTPTSTEIPAWASGEEDHFVADVVYDFTGETREEIAIKSGQRINIAPKEKQPKVRGWLLGCSEGKIGLVPANYVKVIGKKRGQKSMEVVGAPSQLAETQGQLNTTGNSTLATTNEEEMDAIFNVPDNVDNANVEKVDVQTECETSRPKQCCSKKT
ncbi:hypothetical protein LOTGIDRAFT_120815 [Lottia gigantea]|uniref:Peroxisomal membrane protein PEX13 n=1 Tax=Lottia gigantea TaxID=225164 RepID=V3ZM68_LOTGI|nr:hypothetical protein LOTGIDRAFT_120815 [Lottia gigantea]ESO92453.1 hypothetical protein LOTGIDRAFT_120815 [Lottia gigantea]